LYGLSPPTERHVPLTSHMCSFAASFLFNISLLCLLCYVSVDFVLIYHVVFYDDYCTCEDQLSLPVAPYLNTGTSVSIPGAWESCVLNVFFIEQWASNCVVKQGHQHGHARSGDPFTACGSY